MAALSAFADEVSFFSVADGQVWDTKGSTTHVVTDIYTAAASQKWIRTEPVGNNLMQYQSVANPTRCLAAPNTSPGAALVLVPCFLDGPQLWVRIASQVWLDLGSRFCATQIAIGARGLPLTQNACVFTPLQQWRIWNHTTQSWE